MARIAGNKIVLVGGIFIAAVMLPLWSPAVYASDMEVPIAQQYSIFMKILECDRGLAVHDDSVVVFAIIYQSSYKQSLNTHDELMETITKSPVSAIFKTPVKYISIDLSQIDNLGVALKSEKVDVVYISPLRAYKVEDIAALCRALSVTSLTGVTEYLELGLSVSIADKGGKPQIVVNLSASKAEGANFNSQMLKLARVIK